MRVRTAAIWATTARLALGLGAAMAWGDGTARTGTFTLMALGDNRLSDVQALEGRYDLLICSEDVKPEVIEEFRKRNPGAGALCYLNTSDVNADMARYEIYGKRWDETNSHEDWFHHDAAGARVKMYYPKFKNRFAFNTGNPELQAYLAAMVVEILKTGRYDGLQLDNVSTDYPFKRDLVGKWISAEPVELTPKQWTADEVAMLRKVKKGAEAAGFKSKVIIYNHMRSGEPTESVAYLGEVDGANCENWLSTRTALEGRWGWKAKVDQVLQANRMGKISNLLCTPGKMTEEEALFCFASYLMAKEGEQAYFFFAPGYRISAQATWYAFYDTDIGKEAGEYEARDGGFWRNYSKGGVAVNPTTESVTMRLPGRYATLAGKQVTEVPLAGKRAILLRKVQAK